MRTGELLVTDGYKLGEMAAEAARHEANEAAVTAASTLFATSAVPMYLSGNLAYQQSMNLPGVDGYWLRMGAKAQVTEPFDEIDHNGTPLATRLARVELVRRSGAVKEAGKASILMVGLTHESQRSVNEGLYRWGVFHEEGRDSVFFRVHGISGGVRYLPCTPEQEADIVVNLNRATEKLG